MKRLLLILASFISIAASVSTIAASYEPFAESVDSIPADNRITEMINEKTDQLAVLNKTLETMDAIENSSQGYSLSQVEGDIGNPILVDIVDEAHAYKAQYAYDNNSVNGINPTGNPGSIHDINSTIHLRLTCIWPIHGLNHI